MPPMDVDSSSAAAVDAAPPSSMRKTLFLALNCILLAVGNCGGPLIMRLYYIRGGHRIWLACWLQTGGWPIILIPLAVAYRRRPPGDRFFMKPHVLAAAVAIGVATGFDNYMYSYGVNKLPVSTAQLIVATQLVFTSTFSYLIVKHKFTAYSVNAVVLLTAGAVVLGLHANGDRPTGESGREYLAGFLMTLGGAASLVLQMQLVYCFVATAFCTVAMLANRDFQAIPREARGSQLGESRYYILLGLSPILWQCFFLGVIGVIFYASSLLSSIIITVTIPITQILAVLIYGEKFHPEKGISLFLCLWGFISYSYGEVRKMKKERAAADNDNQKLSSDITQP